MKKLLLILSLVLCSTGAFAQTAMSPCVQSTNGAFTSCAPVTASNPFPVTFGTGALTLVAPVYIGTSAITDTGVLLQATSDPGNTYNQVVVQNTDAGNAASANYVVNNNLGTATTFYGEFGMNSSTFTGTGSLNGASTVYLDSQSGDLALGTLTSNKIHFVVNNGATDAMMIDTSGNVMVGTNTAATLFTVNGVATGGSFVPTSSTCAGNSLCLAAANTTTLSASGNKVLFVTAANVETTSSDTHAVDAASSIFPVLYLNGTTQSQVSMALPINSANALPPIIWLSKSRGAGAGTFTVVQSGDGLGTINFSGADGSVKQLGAQIAALVNGTPGAGSMPTDLVFYTSASGSGTPTERLRITTTGGLTYANASTHAGQATCWTTSGAIGYCTSVVGAGGGCTCTGL